MELEELINLYQSLMLGEEEEKIVTLDKSIAKIREKKLINSLVGKVLSNILINRKGLRMVIQKTWRTIKEVKVESLGGNCFIFQFNSEGDKRRIMSTGPWFFDKSLIVLVEPKGVGDVT